VGVLELKNFSQFAVISATALALLLVAGTGVAGPTGVDASVGVLEADVVAEELLELLHPASAAASARPTAGTRIRRATNGDRMTRS
jgi:hypothetical protein